MSGYVSLNCFKIWMIVSPANLFFESSKVSQNDSYISFKLHTAKLILYSSKRNTIL